MLNADQLHLVNIHQILERVQNNDPTLLTLNLNSYTDNSDPEKLVMPKPEWATQLARALRTNTYIKELEMANAEVTPDTIPEFVAVIKGNSTLTKLGLESNKITSEGVVALLEALQSNTSLVELKLANQYKLLSSDVERTIAKLLEPNTTVTKVTVTVREQSSRNSIDKIIFRNQDLARKNRRAKK